MPDFVNRHKMLNDRDNSAWGGVLKDGFAFNWLMILEILSVLKIYWKPGANLFAASGGSAMFRNSGSGSWIIF